MFNRISSGMVDRFVKSSLTKLEAQSNTLSKAQITGQRVSSVSEDPVAIGKSIMSQSNKRNILQNARSNFRIESLSNISYESVKGLYNICTRAQELCVYGSSGMNKEDLFAYAEEVDGLISQTIGQINLKYVNTYLFGASKAYQKPFTVEQDANGAVSKINYNGGNAEPFKLPIGNDISISGINTSAQNLDLLSFANHLVALRDALKNKETDTIFNLQAALNMDETKLNINMNSLVAKTQMTKSAKSTLDSQFTAQEATISSLLDVDITELSIKIQAKQRALEMATLVSKTLMQHTGGLLQSLFSH